MMKSLALTVIGPDRPGLISNISEVVALHQASWLESRMANLAGQFAGIVHLQVLPEHVEPLLSALRQLEGEGLHVSAVSGLTQSNLDTGGRTYVLTLLGQDHPGIVRDVSSALATHGISIAELETETFSASMSGENMFKATATLLAPATMLPDTLDNVLHTLSDSLMVDMEIEEQSP